MLVGRGRAVHLLAGPPAKKRKLNEMSAEDGTYPIGNQENLKTENEQLKAALA